MAYQETLLDLAVGSGADEAFLAAFERELNKALCFESYGASVTIEEWLLGQHPELLTVTGRTRLASMRNERLTLTGDRGFMPYDMDVESYYHQPTQRRKNLSASFTKKGPGRKAKSGTPRKPHFTLGGHTP